jgi:hypothetical protein
MGRGASGAVSVADRISTRPIAVLAVWDSLDANRHLVLSRSCAIDSVLKGILSLRRRPLLGQERPNIRCLVERYTRRLETNQSEERS